MSKARNTAAASSLESAHRQFVDEAGQVRLEPPPATRADCSSIPRPCRRACRYQTGITLGPERAGNPNGGRRRILPLWRPAFAGCALDEARHGGLNLAEVGDRIGCSDDAIRVIEMRAIRKLKGSGIADDLIAALLGLAEVG